jgi:MoaA/NifB/PqqE/SkfB family radical SAM enzyme
MNGITHLNVEVTRRCHQRCFYCFNESNARLEHTPYSPSQWLRVLTKLSGEGLRSIHLTGGEPFSWWGTVELLQGGQKLDLKTSVLSNGYRIPQLVGQHSNTFEKLDVAQISLDAMNPSVHDLRRGTRGAWTQAIQAIEALQALRVRLEISAVISDSNLEEIPNLAAYCADLGAKLLIRPLLPFGRGKPVSLAHDFETSLQKLLKEVAVAWPELVISDAFFYLPQVHGGAPANVATMHKEGLLRLDTAAALAIPSSSFLPVLRGE